MTVEIISWSISTKVWDRAGIELPTPGSAVRLASVARHVTDCATRPGHPLDGPPAVIRVDPAPGFMALRNDETLKSLRLSLEIGCVKNLNKNPVAERAILELEEELLKQEPTGGPVSQLGLAIAVARLNSRIG